VIFVHGVGGDPITTWCHEGAEEDGYFWPQWIAEDIDGAAVYTLGYPADKAAWNTGWPLAVAAVAVLNKLMVSRDLRKHSETPIAFVCHSLGGLIIKKLVLTAHLDRGQAPGKGIFLDRIAGVAFLATPHGGSIFASVAEAARWFVSKSVSDLKGSDAALLDLAHSYRDRIANKEAVIRHCVYYETVGRWGAQVVTPLSADLGIAGVRPVPVNRDHMGICKPTSRDDAVYEGVVAFLADEVLQPREPSQNEKFDELLALARGAGAFQRAAEQGISEAAVRRTVERLGGEGIGRDDLVPWLDNWIDVAVEELGRRTNEDDAFEAARQEAERRFKAGFANPSAALMDEFAREERAERDRQEERKRRRLRILEEAVHYDELVLDTKAAIEKLHRMAAIEELSGWEEIGAYLFGHASEYSERGQQKGENSALLLAIFTYRAALEELTRERVPLDWAKTQSGLGTALSRLGERERGTARLGEAVAAYHAALEEFARQRMPLEWAMTLTNLSDTLMILGERESGTARLEEAVAACRAALEVGTRDRAPLDWAVTQNNLGNALAALGRRERSTARLEEAVAAYRAALEERTRERVPLDWAMTQNNLGGALTTLGERESGTARLEEAVAAYRAALKERTRERVPLEWAMTHNNLGNALTTLGERESGTARLNDAVAAYHAALEEWRRERVPLDWAMTQNNLGTVLATLGRRESGTAWLEEAVAAYQAALEEWTRDRVPLQWATTQHNLGTVLATLGRRESGTARLEEAVAAYRAALEECTRERVPLDWAMTQANLGDALAILGERERGRARLEEAVAAYRAALEEWTREHVPLDWAKVQGNLGNVLKTLGRCERDAARLKEAVSAYMAALAVFRTPGLVHLAELTTSNLREVEGMLKALKMASRPRR
jgi:tetratricopeptide (TPR) repeat protein